MAVKRWSDRKTVEECTALPNFFLAKYRNKAGLYDGKMSCKRPHSLIRNLYYKIQLNDQAGDMAIRYEYMRPNSILLREVEQTIPLASSECGYRGAGGRRWWFRCPKPKADGYCGRRVGKLYVTSDDSFLGCRLCLNLTYAETKRHNKSIDRLVHNPDLISAYIESNTLRRSLLGLSAFEKLQQILDRKRLPLRLAIWALQRAS